MRTNELHCSAKQVQRSEGRSSVAAVAYRSATLLVDERTGLIHDYTKKQGVEHTRIYAPDNAPEWANDRSKLWNAAEVKENRKNSMTARELEIAFPHEFNAMQRRETGDAVSREIMRRYNCAVDIAYHEPNKNGDDRNYHAHIMFTTRGFDENTKDGWERTKYRNLNKDQITIDGEKVQRSKYEIEALREFTAKQMNIIAEREKLEVITEHLSFETRGIDHAPTKKMGVKATAMERRGEVSERGEENRKIQAANDNFNSKMMELHNADNVISLEIEREKRRIAKNQEQLKTQAEESRSNVQKEKLKDGFNQEAKGKEATTSQAFNAEAESGYAHHIWNNEPTKEIANEFLWLAQNPLSDLRGWLDETRDKEQVDNSLLAGQTGSNANDNALRQVRAEDRGGNPQDGENRAAGEENSNSGQNHQGEYDRDAAETEQQNRLEAAAVAHAKEQEQAEVLAHKLEQKQQAAQKAALAFANREKWAKYQQTIDEKTAVSKVKHKIDEFEEKRNNAVQNLVDNSGFWNRLTGKTAKADHALWAAQMTLDKQLERWKADIEAFNQNSPQWVQKRELEKQSFVVVASKAQSDQDKGRTDQQQARADVDNALLDEAVSSPENAERLQHSVKAKTPSQKAKIATVKSKAQEHERGIEQSKKSEIQKEHEEVKRHDKERQRDITAHNDKVAGMVAGQNEKDKEKEVTPSPALSQEQSELAAEYEQSAHGGWFSSNQEQERGGWFSNDFQRQQERAEELAEYRAELEQLDHGEEERQYLLDEFEQAQSQEQEREQDQGYEHER